VAASYSTWSVANCIFFEQGDTEILSKKRLKLVIKELNDTYLLVTYSNKNYVSYWLLNLI